MPKDKSGRRRHWKSSSLPQILIIGGVVLLVVVILLLKPGKKTAADGAAGSGDLPSVQLDRALQAGQPALAFFHSNNCEQCIIMMETVNQVYPEFTASVVLVDINVYDDANTALLQRVGLQYIPTLIFYDCTGKEQVSVGVMEADQLRQTLAALAGGD